jgi:hypothetical protein
MSAAAPEPEPVDSFTPQFLLEVIRDACVRLDPAHAEAYRSMGADHVREAVRINTRLLYAHREYQRRYRIARRGRRQHAQSIYRYLDVVPQPYLVVAAAWSLLPTALLNPPEPDPSRRSPLRTDHGHGAGAGVIPDTGD